MSNLSDKKTGFFFTASTVLMFCFPVLPFAIRSIITGIWLVSCIIYSVQHKGEIKFSKKNIRQLSIILLPFLLVVLSLLYTENIKKGGDLAVRILPLILCPVFFFLCRNQLNQKLLQICKLVFVLGTFLIVAYSFLNSYHNRAFLDRPLEKIELDYNGVTKENITKEKESEIKYRRFKRHVEEVSGTHSTYLGLFIILSVFFIGQFLFEAKQSVYLKILASILALSMFGWLAYLSVRAPIMAFVIGVIAVFIFKIRNPKIILSGLLGSTILFMALYTFVPSLQMRVDEVIENKFALPKSGTDPLLFNSTNVRLGSLFWSAEIIQSNPFTGVGVGDVQDALNECYTNEIGAIIYTWDTYNSHNQYLFFGLAAGLLGILSFLFQTLYFIFLSIKRQHGIAIFFFVSAAVIFLSENLLVRSDGITYYALFGSFLIFFNSEKK